jgi:hypothetical protein
MVSFEKERAAPHKLLWSCPHRHLRGLSARCAYVLIDTTTPNQYVLGDAALLRLL